jgi:hypothetical protein
MLDANIIEAEDASLRSLNEQFRFFYDRLENIAKHHRRRIPVRDLTFQEEFRSKALELRKLADDCQDFWRSARMEYYSRGKQKFVQENRLNIKQIKKGALSFNRQVDELYTIYKNLNSEGKDLPLRLNWWLMESAANDLSKITNNILFLIRDMEKYYE